LNSPKKKQSSEEQQAEAFLTKLETAAGVMMAAKFLINWLDHKSSSLISDYGGFREEVHVEGCT